MNPEILLVNPPIYDFSAYDYWLRPYGLLEVAGYLRGQADFTLFDFMDREHEFMSADEHFHSEKWGRGRFCFQKIDKPKCFARIPRYFRRFGLPRDIFQSSLGKAKFDYVFIQTLMTFWYPGVAEVIEDIRKIQPQAKIILGGVYATICPDHAATLGADFISSGMDLKSLWKFLKIEPDLSEPALWESYPKLKTAAVKLTDGCPFKCTYCLGAESVW